MSERVLVVGEPGAAVLRVAEALRARPGPRVVVVPDEARASIEALGRSALLPPDAVPLSFARPRNRAERRADAAERRRAQRRNRRAHR